MSQHFNEADHPRGIAGRFATKHRTAPSGAGLFDASAYLDAATVYESGYFPGVSDDGTCRADLIDDARRSATALLSALNPRERERVYAQLDHLAAFGWCSDVSRALDECDWLTRDEEFGHPLRDAIATALDRVVAARNTRQTARAQTLTAVLQHTSCVTDTLRTEAGELHEWLCMYGATLTDVQRAEAGKLADQLRASGMPQDAAAIHAAIERGRLFEHPDTEIQHAWELAIDPYTTPSLLARVASEHPHVFGAAQAVRHRVRLEQHFPFQRGKSPVSS